MELKELLALEKRNFLIRANGGIAMPAAGFIYWLAAGIAGFYVQPQLWIVAVCFCSGLIFPLALALAKPLKSNVMAKSELSSLLFPALLSMLTFWPLALPVARAILPLYRWPLVWVWACTGR